MLRGEKEKNKSILGCYISKKCVGGQNAKKRKKNWEVIVIKIQKPRVRSAPDGSDNYKIKVESLK